MNVVYEFTEKFYEEQVITRLNRFLVKALVDGREVNCHLHDLGRLKELIYLGDIVLIRDTRGEKTNCSITAAYANGTYVIIDSRLHNKIASKFLPSNSRREIRIGDSKIDFML